MNDDIRGRLRSVAEDLDHLRDDWWNDPPDAVIRRGSVILRRLLAEGVLQRAWRAYGFAGQPTIVAPNLDELLGRDRPTVVLALAGGAHAGGMLTSGLVLNQGTDSHINPALTPEGTVGAISYPYKLSDFTESICVFVGGDVIKRREIVKYFAHFEGGAHLHLSRRVRRDEEDMVRRIKKIEGRVQAHQKDGLYFELLSIGQAVGRSEDTQRLAEAIRRTAI